jgi:hypothetical protein
MEDLASVGKMPISVFGDLQLWLDNLLNIRLLVMGM